MESVFQFWQNVARGTKRLMPLQVFAAQVEDVDEKKRTCTVKVNEGVSFEDVRLYGLTDEGLKGFCLIPKRDSMVLVGRIDNGNELYVTMFSEVDKVLGTIGDKVELSLDEEAFRYMSKGDTDDKKVTLEITDGKVTVDADEIVFNGGHNKGLVKIKELTELLNGFIDKFNGHTHTIPQGNIVATSLKADPASGTITGTIPNVSVPAPAQGNQVDKIDKNEGSYAYEDTSIKH